MYENDLYVHHKKFITKHLTIIWYYLSIIMYVDDNFNYSY